MKKLLSLLMILMVLLTSGCETAATLLVPEDAKEKISKEVEIPVPETEKPKSELFDNDGTKNKIAKSITLETSKGNTTMMIQSVNITNEEVKDTIILETDAKEKNGEMIWEDSQYWTLMVLVDENNDGTEDVGYNLYNGEMQGRVYVEVNEYLIQGIATPVITAYIFGGRSREIREYIFDGEFFVETITYTTDTYSTGIINKITTIPDPVKP